MAPGISLGALAPTRSNLDPSPITHVLSDLFNMGAPPQTSSKSSRKQKNPKFCILHPSPAPDLLHDGEEGSSSACVRKDENAHAPSASFNSLEHKKLDVHSDSKMERSGDVEEEEKEKGEQELLGYSRSEVTVIDTSCDVWKFDKLLYRRKNVWKVRDKKGKSRIVGRKKRKPTAPHPTAVSNKKIRNSTSDIHLLQEAYKHQCGPLSKHGQLALGDKSGQVCKETSKDHSQYSKKRLPRKSRKGGLSAVLIKAIPTNTKDGAKVPKSNMKGSQG